MGKENAVIPVGVIEQRILLIRGRKVVLDVDLAKLYGVPTKAFNQAVKRNLNRFPQDFMFQLTRGEKHEVVTNCDHLQSLKYSASLPYAFTEHGALMAASVLNSERAVHVSVYVVRAFVKLREMLAEHKELSQKLGRLEAKLAAHDQKILLLVDAIKRLTAPEPLPKRRRIGFHAEEVP